MLLLVLLYFIFLCLPSRDKRLLQRQLPECRFPFRVPAFAVPSANGTEANIVAVSCCLHIPPSDGRYLKTMMMIVIVANVV